MKYIKISSVQLLLLLIFLTGFKTIDNTCMRYTYPNVSTIYGVSPDSTDSFTSNKLDTANSKFEIILTNVYRFKDVCNVYLLKSGSSGILIDAGSGKVLEHLKEVGVEKIDWVLHTHSHRDQCIGDMNLKKQGSKIAIGKSEAAALLPAGIQPPFDVPKIKGETPDWIERTAAFIKPGVDRAFEDGEEFIWNQYKIKVVNTPGHTEGSVSYLVEVAGKTICFSGDLIIDGGYVHELYSMQWVYLENPGIDSSLISLEKISTLAPHILLPSHGEIIDEPYNEIRKLTTRLLNADKLLKRHASGRWNWSTFVQVSEHVIQDCETTSQFVVSNTGEALMFDCGREFTVERLEVAKKKFGIKRIAVIIPSHWHGDHSGGVATLAKAEGAQVWVWEGLAEHLEYPERFETTCWRKESVKADRILKGAEEFRWGGISFKAYHHPAHMEEQMGLLAQVDELRFYFLADGTYLSRESNIRNAIHCYNGISLSTGFLKSAQSFYDANPYIGVPAHANCFATQDNARDEYVEWAVKATDAIKSLLTPPNLEMGYNPYWATFYPAKVRIKAGEETRIALRLKNKADYVINGKFLLKSYGDILLDQKPVEYILGPGETKDFSILVKSKKTARAGIHIVTADIEYNHKLYGELPQGYVQIDE